MRLKSIIAMFCAVSALTCINHLEAASNGKVGVVNFKYCVEKSKVGQKEQENFDKMKKDMEASMEKKEKEISELASKLNDENYMDSLSDKAEAELKQKFGALSQQIQQEQARFYQMLNQAQYKVVQKIHDLVSRASKSVAEQMGLTQVFNHEVLFYFDPSEDISDKVVVELDKNFNG